ncbi:MAG: hypothetical protein M3495_03840 [Pseudomonadota bacterium]|nr:hypothetical protein [Gammaproteobacteria bacterium]MDQ3580790.1 hypothetical protein [Pseudomonadota bacterium]
MRAGAASLLLALCVGSDVCADGEAYLRMTDDEPRARARDVPGAVVRAAPTSGAPGNGPLRALAEVLRGLAAQAEALQRGLEDLPRSEEAQRLAEEWRRILDEIARAKDDAEESLREDILPRLQDELEALKKRLEELQPKERRPPTPVGIWI